MKRISKTKIILELKGIVILSDEGLEIKIPDISRAKIVRGVLEA